MRRDWRLVRGYLWRMDRGTTFFFASLIVPVFVMGILLPGSDAFGLELDYLRTILAAAVFGGPFFRSPEVVGRPVSRRQLWRVQWLVATLGMTALLLVLRVVVLTTRGDLSIAIVAQTTLADFFGCSVAGGLVALLFHPDKPSWARTLPASIVMLIVVLAALFGTPVWSAYVRSSLGAGAILVKCLALLGLTLTILAIGLWAVPRSFLTFRHGGMQWNDVGIGQQGARLGAGAKLAPGSGGRGGPSRWVLMKLSSALLCGVGAVVLPAVVSAILPGFNDVPLTFVQRLAGQLVDGGGFPPFTVLLVAAMWVLAVEDNLRMTRLLPLSRAAIASTLTAGLLTSLTVAVLVQAVAFRAGFGVWPPTLPIAPTMFIACVAALVKSVRFVAPNRFALIGVAAALMPIAVEASNRLAPSMPIALSVVAGLCVILLSLRLDITLLAESSQIYRVNRVLP